MTDRVARSGPTVDWVMGLDLVHIMASYCMCVYVCVRVFVFVCMRRMCDADSVRGRPSLKRGGGDGMKQCGTLWVQCRVMLVVGWLVGYVSGNRIKTTYYYYYTLHKLGEPSFLMALSPPIITHEPCR